MPVLERPCELGVDSAVEIADGRAGDLVQIKPVEPEEPIGVVQPVLWLERRDYEGQFLGPVGTGRKRRIADPYEFVVGVEPRAVDQPAAMAARKPPVIRRRSQASRKVSPELRLLRVGTSPLLDPGSVAISAW